LIYPAANDAESSTLRGGTQRLRPKDLQKGDSIMALGAAVIDHVGNISFIHMSN
jgi:hypothetical protein